jgi:uncharacterized protein (DUF1697 family)
VPTYVAFLRAINLGAKRKFPKAAITAAVEAAGGTDVETYINTGNVRLTTSLRSRAKVEEALERAFAADRGFEVPTIVFTPEEVVDIAEVADKLWAEHGEPAGHYVTLYKQAPTAAAIAALAEREWDGEMAVVEGRAAHGLLYRSFHESRLLSSRLFEALGHGTSRNVKVIRAVAGKWC